MEAFSYLTTLVSIVIGLALTEVAGSMNRQLREDSSNHDPLIYGLALLVVLMLVATWFDFWAVRRIPNLFTFPFFLILFGQLLLLYLLACACVPWVRDGNGPVASYEANRRYFWRLFFIYELLYLGVWAFFATKGGMAPIAIVERGLLQSGEIYPLIISAVLVFARRRIVHATGIAVLIGLLLWGFWASRIG